jgi:hypothetical protein
VAVTIINYKTDYSIDAQPIKIKSLWHQNQNMKKNLKYGENFDESTIE